MEALLPPYVLQGDDDCNRCVTAGAANDTTTSIMRHAAAPVVAAARSIRSTRFMLHIVVLHRHRGCARRSRLCTVAQCLRTPFDPANAFTFHGAVGDGRAAFPVGSMCGERVQVNAANFSSAASPWALPGGGSDACAPPVDLAVLVQLTAWIKALGELIRM